MLRRSALALSIAFASIATLAAASWLAPPMPEQAVATPATATSSQQKPPRSAAAHVVGHLACAAAGCHGAAVEGTSRDWRSAYSVWATEDPHRRAFLVLYSERSVEIYRNLNLDERNQPNDKLDDQHYLRFLQDRCIGCHATGSPGQDRIASPDPLVGQESYLGGVSCESCHGAASVWLHPHYTKTFSRSTAGFIDTKNLWTRAGVCTGCHVGPMTVGDIHYDVNHDLIAAGHPRMTFEMDAYLENLPKHWNLANDIQRHEAQSGSFHVDAWRFGQAQTARQLVKQLQVREKNGHDFANYDCFGCHHAIRNLSDRTSPVAKVVRTGLPKFVSADLLAVAAATGKSPVAPELGLVPAQLQKWGQAHGLFATRRPAADAALPLANMSPDAQLLLGCPPRQVAEHARALADSLGKEAEPRRLNWDETVQFYLAVQALSRDWQDAALAKAGEDLLAKLAPQAGGPYESPARFNSADLNPELQAARQALTNPSSTGKTP